MMTHIPKVGIYRHSRFCEDVANTNLLTYLLK